jgi:ComF family protein
MGIAVNSGWRAAVDGFGRLLWPPCCLLCGEPGDGDQDLCAGCRRALPWSRTACPRCAIPLPLPAPACGGCLRRPPPTTLVRAAFVYGFPLDRLLPGLKFHQGLAAGRLLSQLMCEAFAEGERPGALVPVPLHRARLRARGYDQALELARPLARSLGLPLLDRALLRQRVTAPQSRLGAEQRRRNLRGAFAVARGAPLPEHVALFDDVMTTGATLHAAADALLRAGVRRVDAWVCARVP